MRKRRLFFVVLCILLVATSASAAQGDIRTIAGGGVGEGIRARDAFLRSPWNVALAPDGSLVLTDKLNHRVRRIAPGEDGDFDGDATETISTIAGTGETASTGDGGPATGAALYQPSALAFDPAGNLYVGDTQGGRVRRIEAGTSTISTFAGGGACCSPPVDGGPANPAYLNQPQSLAWHGNALYIGTYQNLYRVSGGVITRVGGGSGCVYGGDVRDGGPATNACFSNIYGLTADAHGSLIVSDTYNDRIRRIAAGADGVVDGDADEIISTVAGNGQGTPADDSKHPTQQACASPAGLDFDAAGNLVFAESARVRRLSPGADGVVNGSADERLTTIAGERNVTTRDATPANLQPLNYPRDVDVLAGDVILVADTGANRVRVIDDLGVMIRIAGNETFLGDDGPATLARLAFPNSIAHVAGNLYVSDSAHGRVRRIDPGGIMTTVAGGGSPIVGYGDGGHPRSARIVRPGRMASDGDGNLYVIDSDANRLRKITPGADGIVNGGADEQISTVVASDIPGSGTVGPFFPTQVGNSAVATGPDGSVYFAGPYTIWRIAPGGTFTRVAGSGVRGSWGDCNQYGCNPAIEAGFTRIGDIAVDGGGRMYVVDGDANRIRLVTPGSDGIVDGGPGEYVYTVAGSCTSIHGYLECSGFAGDGGPATSALLRPSGIALGSDGSLYIAESGNFRVRRVAPGDDGVVTGGAGEIITTMAGSGANGFLGDGGPATLARFNGPVNVLAGPASLWIVDSTNDRIREVEL